MVLIGHVRTLIAKFKDGCGLTPAEVWADLTLHGGIAREALASQEYAPDKRVPLEQGTGDPVVDGVPVRLRIVRRGTIEARHPRAAGKLVIAIGDATPPPSIILPGAA